MDIVIFANGQLTNPQQAKASSRQADLVIAVDGGANHCDQLGITPDILLGDLDSITTDILANYEKNNVTIHRYPVEKDKTDLELALDLALTQQASRITIFAALGGRWDMSLANLHLLAAPAYSGADIVLFGEQTTIGVCRGGEKRTLSFSAGTTVSLLPFGGDVAGVTTTGFKYPLTNETLKYTSSRGVSNVLTQNEGTILVQSGVLLWVALCVDKK